MMRIVPPRKSVANGTVVLPQMEDVLNRLTKRRNDLGVTQTMTSSEETYFKISEREHPLLRPGMYIGSVEPEEVETYVVEEDGELRSKKVCVSPGLLKVFDELLVNAADHRVRTVDSETPCTVIKVDIEEGCIRVWNDGPGIDVRKHSEIDIWIPQMIFGDLRTGNNFSDNEKRVTGGLNGLGAKLCNIFSKRFRVTTLDTSRGLSYTQEWTDNMSNVGTPTVKKSSNKKAFTCIEFWPDFSRFGTPEETFTTDTVAVFRRRVHDISVTGGGHTKTYLNGRVIKVNALDKYTKCMIPSNSRVIYYEHPPRWKIGVAFTPNNGFRAVSFVNSINTYVGGTHVDHVLNPLVKSIQDDVETKLKKQYRPTPSQVREHLFICVDALIENPSFSSQQKEELKTKSKDFGSACKLDKDFIDKVLKSGIVKHVSDILTGKAKETLLKDSDGKKTSRISGIPKLVDAEWAGTSKSMNCVLILTEGDSAKTTAIAAISDLPSTDKKRFGVFPLRGKVMNICETALSKIDSNAEIGFIKKILGLQQGRTYKDLSELRYGKVLIMTDQDEDGSHIKGLLLNLFYSFWPSLVEKDFISSLSTPIIRVFNKKGGALVKEFYTQFEYDEWEKAQGDVNSKYRAKHYKGLGTSTRQESKEYLRNWENKIITYHDEDGRTSGAIRLAFDPKKSDERKDWLLEYNPQEILSHLVKRVPTADFINLELKHFSMSSLKRAIPDLIDGFTPSRRKVIYTAIKRNLWNQNSEVRVSQLAGAVSELTCFHHGEQSLQQTIVRLAQDYCGSNNVNLLVPSGAFGSRLAGGHDSASPRYIMTYLSEIVKLIFVPEDEGILRHVVDDGTVVEPERYLPTIPLVLVNGGDGIGTGWSSFVPQYNPMAIIRILKDRLAGTSASQAELFPWYRGFKGSIDKVVSAETGKVSYQVRGEWKRQSPTSVHISELPVGTWTQNWKSKVIDPLVESKVLDRYTENVSDISVDVTLHFKSATTLDKWILDGGVDKELKLVTSLSISNMHLFPPEANHVKRYATPEEILDEFFVYRLGKYEERKEHMLNVIGHIRDLLEHKVRFIGDVLSGVIPIDKRTKEQVLQDVETQGYRKFGKSYRDDNPSYSYIESMNLFDLTVDKRESLQKSYEEKVREYDVLDRTSIQQLWLTDLERLEEFLHKS